ncbi:leucine-rich repeat-containing protein 56 [Xenentodon cancila]
MGVTLSVRVDTNTANNLTVKTLLTLRESEKMSSCHGSVVQEVRPGSARVLVTELGCSGNINPIPATKPCEDADAAEQLSFSPERLELLCGTEDLSLVTSLEVCINAQESTLGNFGVYLPRLVQLKMNNSLIASVRDLGTSLSKLQVLWMSYCSLKDLDGISTFSCLKELYAAYNSVSDLGQVALLENLELLDLEGNDVDDLIQVQYLSLCPKLHTLTLEGNPVCVCPNSTSTQMTGYSYRAAVRELVPQLRYLDDVNVEEDKLTCCSIEGEDWDILRNSVKECNSPKAASKDVEMAANVCRYSEHTSARRPSSSPSCIRPLTGPGIRPLTGSRPMSAMRAGVLSSAGSRSGSSEFDLAAVEAETSILTHGAGKILFCGNPVQAIRARREKLRTAPTRSILTPRDLPIHIPEHTYDLKDLKLGECKDIIAELKAWREQHSRRLEAIEKERLPQILAIHHDAEEETDCIEEEEFDGFRNNSSDEIRWEDKHCDSLDAASSDSTLQSLSPDLHQQDPLSPDISRLLLSSDATLSPSPPLRATADPASTKMPGIRARRLRLSQETSKHAPDFSREVCDSGNVTAAAGIDFIYQRVQKAASTSVFPVSLAQISNPPPASDVEEGDTNSCADVDLSSLRRHKPEILKHLETRAISAATRTSVLNQHQHHLLQLCRGSSHPN